MRPILRSALVFIVLLVSGVAAAQQQDSHEDFAMAADFGRRFFEAGNFTAALTWLEKADAILRDQPAVLYDTALTLVKLQRYDDAQRILERYIALFPQGKELQQARSLQRELQFGIEVRRRERQDNDYTTLFSRARALYAKGLRRDALEAFGQAEQIHPDDPVLYFNEALLYEEDGALDNALRSYNRYLKLNPASAPQLQPRIIDLEREIGDMRTKLMCPVCGAKLTAGARWCHRCWHGPYDTTSAAWNTRACDAHVTVTRAFQDATGRTRVSEPLACLYNGRSMRDLLQYSPMMQTAVRSARTNEGWTFSPDGVLLARRGASATDVSLSESDHLQRLEVASSGEVFPFKAHATSDGIWLLDSQLYSTGDQAFTIDRTFDNDGRVLREEVRYDSTACRHPVAYVANYTYKGDNVVSAQLTGGYDGFRMEGSPQVRWEATVTRSFDQNARLTREELLVGSFQKTWPAKPQGKVSDEVRRVYTALKTRRPTDIRPTGDICGFTGSRVMDEAIDLRPLFVVSPALAVRLAPGDTKVTVDYAYSDN